MNRHTSHQPTRITSAFRGRSNAKLTTIQRGKLFALMQEAYNYVKGTGAIDDSYDDWRKLEVLKAVQLSSMKDAKHHHYQAIKLHFVLFLPEDRQRKHMTEGTLITAQAVGEATPREMDQKQALHLIKEHCEKHELLYPNYPGAICHRKFSVNLESASPAILAKVLFQLVNNAASKKRRRK